MQHGYAAGVRGVPADPYEFPFLQDYSLPISRKEMRRFDLLDQLDQLD